MTKTDLAKQILHSTLTCMKITSKISDILQYLTAIRNVFAFVCFGNANEGEWKLVDL